MNAAHSVNFVTITQCICMSHYGMKHWEGVDLSQINLRVDRMNLIKTTSLGCREATWAERSRLPLDRENGILTVHKGRFR